MAHEHRARAAHQMFLRVEAAADRRQHAPDIEEARRDPRATDAFRNVARRVGDILHVVAGDGLKRRVQAVPVSEAEGRDVVRRAAGGLFLQAHQLVALGKRERAQDDGVEGGEHRGVRAHAERERQDNGDRETWAPRERPDGVADVTQTRVDDQRHVHVARALTLQWYVAELQVRAAARLVWRHALGTEFVDALGDVERHLALDVAFQTRGSDAVAEAAQPRHDRFPFSAMRIRGRATRPR